MRFGALALAGVVGLTACGGGDDDKKVTATKKSTTTTEALSVVPPEDATTSTTAKSSATTVKGAAAAATTVKLSTGSSGTTNPTAVPGPAAVGTYDYAQSGSTSQGAVPPKGTLVVSGGQTQTFRRYIDPDSSPSDIIFDFRSDGPFITRVVVRQGPATIACTFDAPVPAPPWPPTVGKTFSGHATCGNGFSADFSGSITGTGNDTVGGKSVPVIIINSTLHVFGGGLDVNVKDTQHWAPSLRVPTFSHEVINGTAPLIGAISGDVTSTLTSTSPR